MLVTLATMATAQKVTSTQHTGTCRACEQLVNLLAAITSKFGAIALTLAVR